MPHLRPEEASAADGKAGEEEKLRKGDRWGFAYPENSLPPEGLRLTGEEMRRGGSQLPEIERSDGIVW